MGLGETIDDRIDMAFTLRELGIKSFPVNMLNPIKGTPLENNKKLTLEDIDVYKRQTHIAAIFICEFNTSYTC